MDFLKPFIKISLAITMVILIYLLVSQYNRVIVLNHKNQLTPQTITLLSQLKQPIHYILYTTDSDLHLQIAPYMHHAQRHGKLSYEWHQSIPVHIQAQLPYAKGILIVKMGSQSKAFEVPSKTDEALLLKTLISIQRPQNRWISFLTGHNEADIYEHDNNGLQLFNLALSNQGFHTSHFDSTQHEVLPDNIDFLIIASAQTILLPKEEALLAAYLKTGRNLLWLSDPNTPSIPVLEKTLGINWLPGTVVDMQGFKANTPHPAIALITRFPPNLPFAAPTQLVALPWAKALDVTPKDNWTNTPLLMSNDASWTETNLSAQPIQFDPENNERTGPLLIGSLLTRPFEHSEQRIVVIGNSRFLRNGVIQNYGNLALGINICNWLQGNTLLANINQVEPSTKPIHIHIVTAWVIQYGFTLLLPFAGLILTAVFFFKRRRITTYDASLL